MSDDTTATVMPRQALTDALETAFPDWLVVPSERTPDTLDRPAIIIKQRTIQPLDAAPLSHYGITCLVTIVDDQTDFDLAEDSLDTNVLSVWELLMSLSNVHPTKAEKAMFNQTNLSYDIETDLTVQKG